MIEPVAGERTIAALEAGALVVDAPVGGGGDVVGIEIDQVLVF